MSNFISSFLLIFFSISLIYGCTTPDPIQQFPEITFSHLRSVKINVAKIEVENRFHAPLEAPHIEHLLPMPPSKAMEQWLRDRFQPVGASGTLRLVIEDAKATVAPLSLDKSLRGTLTKQQSQLYQMVARGTLKLEDTNGKVLSSAGAYAERSITTREDITLNTRQKLLLETVIDLMNDFNESIEPNIQSYLKHWLR